MIVRMKRIPGLIISLMVSFAMMVSLLSGIVIMPGVEARAEEDEQSVEVFISAEGDAGYETATAAKVDNHSATEVENAIHSKPKKILILSNRIALNRQLKLAYADFIFKFTGEKDALEKLNDLYTFQGFDKFYMRFNDNIDICSYHQLLERKLLDNNHYDYIVCDEAHFFIQDSLFNHYTDDMLEYIINKGGSSVRIYMSATLNLVMESILRTEYHSLEFYDNFIEPTLNCKIYFMERNINI